MLSENEIKDLLPVLLGNAAALEKSVISSCLSLAERKDAIFLMYHLNKFEQIEVLAGNAEQLTHHDKNGDLHNKIEFLSALMGPGVGDMLNMVATGEEDKNGFFTFFENITKDAFKDNFTDRLIFDVEKKYFCIHVYRENNPVWIQMHITEFININKILQKFGN